MKPEKNQEYQIGDEYKIPVEGSLGLLAVGYKGVLRWRKTILGMSEISDDTHIVGPIVNGKILTLLPQHNRNEEE